jgi:hypothetical protein
MKAQGTKATGVVPMEAGSWGLQQGDPRRL